jgi:hypothetical protein
MQEVVRVQQEAKAMQEVVRVQQEVRAMLENREMYI